MLSHTADFEGGAFRTLEADGNLLSHPFERGDLNVFLSHKYHCVDPVMHGRRQVFVCEWWEGLERRCNERCMIPWGPCWCGLTTLYHREQMDSGMPARSDLRALAGDGLGEQHEAPVE